MECPTCHAQVGLLAESCPQCGTSLADLLARRTQAKLGNSIEFRLEERMLAMDKRIQSRINRFHGGATGPTAPDHSVDETGYAVSNRPANGPGGGSEEGSATVGSKQTISLADLLRPQEADFDWARQAVADCHLLHANQRYADEFSRIRFYFDARDPQFNAFAYSPYKNWPQHERPVLSNGAPVTPPAVVFLGGLAHAIHLSAISVAVYLQERAETNLRFTYRDMGESIVAARGQFPIENSVRVFDRNLRSKAEDLLRRGGQRAFTAMRIIQSSMYLFTTAHEVGHIVLGHASAPSRPNMEISRNQEREADSFAASVLSTSPGREFHFLAAALSLAIMVWEEKATGQREATTHPNSRERFYNYLKSNSEAAQETAAAFGFDATRLEGLLPL